MHVLSNHFLFLKNRCVLLPVFYTTTMQWDQVFLLCKRQRLMYQAFSSLYLVFFGLSNVDVCIYYFNMYFKQVCIVLKLCLYVMLSTDVKVINKKKLLQIIY